VGGSCGEFDPYVFGSIRYIDRDKVSGLLFQGSMARREWTWDFARISLPRLWAGPNHNTSKFAAADAAYVYQFRYAADTMFDVGGLIDYVNDIEVDAADHLYDFGTDREGDDMQPALVDIIVPPGTTQEAVLKDYSPPQDRPLQLPGVVPAEVKNK
jgi:hypothetical protein